MIFFYFLLSKMPYFQTKLRDWIDPTKICYEGLSLNPNAIEFLKENPKLIYWNFYNIQFN